MSARDIRIDVDLSIARNTPRKLAETDFVSFTSFTVVKIDPPGSTFQLAAGQGAPLFPYDVGDGEEVNDPRCDAVTDGLFITNDAQPGATAMIQVGVSSQRTGAL
jgi:hypothetical protein